MAEHGKASSQRSHRQIWLKAKAILSTAKEGYVWAFQLTAMDVLYVWIIQTLLGMNGKEKSGEKEKWWAETALFSLGCMQKHNGSFFPPFSCCSIGSPEGSAAQSKAKHFLSALLQHSLWAFKASSKLVASATWVSFTSPASSRVSSANLFFAKLFPKAASALILLRASCGDLSLATTMANLSCNLSRLVDNVPGMVNFCQGNKTSNSNKGFLILSSK